jgi:Thioredoxin
MGAATDSDFIEEYTKRRYKELLQRSPAVRKLDNEQLFIEKSERDTMAVHFSCSEFRRCKEMNGALDKLCHRFPEVEFYIVEAADFPYVAEKMEIGVLPYLAFFSKGYFIDGVVGFEEIGEERIDLSLLEKRIGSVFGQ